MAILKSGTKVNPNTIAAELVAAGIIGLPFRWDVDGTVHFDDPSVTAAQQKTILQVFANHVGLA